MAVIAQVLGDVEAALAFHADVEQRELGRVRAREDRVVAVVGVDHVVAGLRQPVRDGGEDEAVVVDDEDLSLAGPARASSLAVRVAAGELAGALHAGRPQRHRATTSSPFCLRSSAPRSARQQRAHEAEAGDAARDARQAEARRQAAGVRDRDRGHGRRRVEAPSRSARPSRCA